MITHEGGRRERAGEEALAAMGHLSNTKIQTRLCGRKNPSLSCKRRRWEFWLCVRLRHSEEISISSALPGMSWIATRLDSHDPADCSLLLLIPPFLSSMN